MKNFYKAISIIFTPLLMPTYGILLLFQLPNFHFLPSVFKGVAIGGTFLFTFLLPGGSIYLMKRKGWVSDISLSKREERIMPYLFTFLGYVFWSYFLWKVVEMPMYIVALGAGSSISIFLAVLINTKWKISAHTTGFGGFVGGVFGICYRLGYNPLWLFVLIMFFAILVGLARVEQKAHTPSQVLAGFILGFLSVFLCCLFFN